MAKRWGWYAVTLLTTTGFANLFAICWQMAKNWLMATMFFAVC